MLHIAACSDLPRGTPLQRQDKLRDAVREWLLMIMDKHSVSQRQLGLRSEVSPTTINRALDENGTFVMSTTIISKISAHFGEPPPSALGTVSPQSRSPASSDGDLTPFAGALAGLPPKTETNHYRGRVTSDVLNLEGFRPGDLCDFDTGVKAEAGDIVVAQHYQLRGGQPETVLRLYQPPYLLTRSTNLEIDPRPLYVDNERVVIIGTFVRLVRERAA